MEGSDVQPTGQGMQGVQVKFIGVITQQSLFIITPQKVFL